MNQRDGGAALLAAGALLALSLCSLAAGQADVGVLRTGSFYESSEPGGGGTAIVAPRAAVLAGQPLAGGTALRQSPEACSALCRSTDGCAWFQFCGEQVGCSSLACLHATCWPPCFSAAPHRPHHPRLQGGCTDAGAGEPLAHLECRMLTANCSLPTVASQGARVQVTSGAWFCGCWDA